MLRHPNLVQMWGLSLKQKPWLCVIEFMKQVFLCSLSLWTYAGLDVSACFQSVMSRSYIATLHTLVLTCGMWRAACGVWRVACGVWRVACGVWRPRYGDLGQVLTTCREKKCLLSR
jgi:hypothetical protein